LPLQFKKHRYGGVFFELNTAGYMLFAGLAGRGCTFVHSMLASDDIQDKEWAKMA
jgi:hypothetical protein